VPAFIRHPKDFWTGIIFLAFGLAAIVFALELPMGSVARMGPAYFPSVLGGLLALVGLLAVVRSFLRDGEPVGSFHIKGMALVLGAILLFGYLMRGAGLAPSIVLLVLLSALASPGFRLRWALPLAIGLAVFAVVMFVRLLGLPMPVIGPWLDF
jgi:hypothetical protein